MTVEFVPWVDESESVSPYFSHGRMGVSENSVPLNPMVNDHYHY